MLLVILLIVVLLGFGGYWGGNQYGYGPQAGIGTIVLIILILYLLGYLHR